jgi:hypothetical protein
MSTLEAPAPDAPAAPPTFPPAIEVRDLDWPQVRAAIDVAAIRARLRGATERMEALLESGPGMMFDRDREHAGDRAIRVSAPDAPGPLWIIGDLHGDLLALEASLALIHRDSAGGSAPPRIIFLGDFVDDEGFALEVLVRVFELVVDAPERICVIAGNHDEALSHDGVDLHPALEATRDWNDPACLSDFVWARAHPKARKKLPNRFSRGSQFGYEDFADFCALAARLDRPVTHFVRGHDHVEERFAIYPAYQAHPVLTTVALSRRLPRESVGPYERTPTLVRVTPGSLPQVYQLVPPAELVTDVFPPPVRTDARPVDSCMDDSG